MTPDEYAVIVTHPVLTDEILQHLPFLTKVRRIISEHHERFDGNGYPHGLKGEEISLEGRMLAIADAYDAMRSGRPYRSALKGLRHETVSVETMSNNGKEQASRLDGA